MIPSFKVLNIEGFDYICRIMPLFALDANGAIGSNTIDAEKSKITSILQKLKEEAKVIDELENLLVLLEQHRDIV